MVRLVLSTRTVILLMLPSKMAYSVYIQGIGGGEWAMSTKQRAIQFVDRKLLKGEATKGEVVYNGLVIYKCTGKLRGY